jgi:hypothetical protein
LGFLRWPLTASSHFFNPSNTSLILFSHPHPVFRPHRPASVVSRPLPLLLPSNPTPTPASLYLASQSSISLSAGSTSRKSCVQVPCIRTSISRSAPPHSPRYSLPDQYSRVSDHHRSLQLKPSKTRAHHSLLHSFTTATNTTTSTRLGIYTSHAFAPRLRRPYFPFLPDTELMCAIVLPH